MDNVITMFVTHFIVCLCYNLRIPDFKWVIVVSCANICTGLCGEFVCYKFETKHAPNFHGMLDTETLEERQAKEQHKRTSVGTLDEEEGQEMVEKNQRIPEVI